MPDHQLLAEDTKGEIPRGAHETMSNLQKKTSLIVLVSFFFGGMSGYFYANEQCGQIVQSVFRNASTVMESQQKELKASYDLRIKNFELSNTK